MGSRYTKPAVTKSVHFDEFKKTDLKPDLKSNIIAITGTTSGTGFIAAKTVGELGATVLLLNRSSQRSEDSFNKLTSEVPNGTFVKIDCDLQDFASVQTAIEEIKTKYDHLSVLANNAGVMALEDKATKDGYDIQMQTNVLSHFLLTKELYPLLVKGAELEGEARIVNHSSIARYGSNLKEQYFGKNGGNLGGNGSSLIFGGARWERYHQTKLAAAVFTYCLDDRLKEKNSKVKAIVCHPGLASTNLQVTTAQDGGMGGMFTNIFMKFGQSQEDGSMGLIKGIAGKNVNSGDFFGPSGGQAALRGKAVLLKPEAALTSLKNKTVFWTSCEKELGQFQI